MPKGPRASAKAILDSKSGQALPRLEPKRCGRCGVVMKKNHFCPACRKFFHLLGRKAILTAT